MCVSGSQPGQDGWTAASAVDAVAAAQGALAWLARADAGSWPADTQAECLRGLERVQSAHTAARSAVMSAFTAQAAFELDGQGTTGTWLAWQTRISRGAAAGAVGWMRRLTAHSRLADALVDGVVSVSWARQFIDWSDRLPENLRDDADAILLAAAAGGAGLADLSGLAEEMYRRSAPPDFDDDDGFPDRGVHMDLTFRGAGKLSGDLTPECAAALSAVLESMGKKAGPEDDRTKPQRDHDALEEGCRRLAASGCLPDVAGQPTQIQLHMTLDQLLDPAQPHGTAQPHWPAQGPGQPQGSGQPQGQGQPLWPSGVPSATGAWLAGRAAGDGQPGWVSSKAAALAYACDAQITPLVTGHLDPAALAAAGREVHPPSARGLSPAAQGLLHDTVLRYAAGILSGPAGLAAHLRAAGPWPGSAGMSLPLDVGAPTPTVPPHLRRAVIARDRHCAFPGCTQKPQACHVHHLTPRSAGGPTALPNLVLTCAFHHLIVIHRWNWTLTLHADGTTTAVSPDRTRTLHSHGPPTATAA